jgi:Uma2 family endonuclease
MSLVVRPAAKPFPRLDQNGAIPLLENGDRLTHSEFMRRYEAMPDVKAELIEGVVYVSSPVRHGFHGGPQYWLIGWLTRYQTSTPGVDGSDNSTVFLDMDNIPQPDVSLFVKPQYGGRVRIDDEGYIVGAPDLVVEIAASSASYDLHDKLKVYRRNGVREYVVYRVLEGEVDWFVLQNGQFEKLSASPDGLMRSTIFPGLWLDVAALVRGDLVAVVAAVQKGLSTPEHAAFVARLSTVPGLK